MHFIGSAAFLALPHTFGDDLSDDDTDVKLLPVLIESLNHFLTLPSRARESIMHSHNPPKRLFQELEMGQKRVTK